MTGMQIRTLTAFEIPVRLRRAIRHASHARSANDTLVVRCELTDGSVGWGEGLPRPFVTGESIESVWRHLTATDFSVLAEVPLNDTQQAVQLTQELQLADVPPDEGITPRECFGNAVRCAIELAVLDAVTRSQGCRFGEIVSAVSEAAPIASKSAEVFYSGVITSESFPRHLHSCVKMKVFGFRQVKLKVGTAGCDDVRNVRWARRILGANTDLRLDANEAWDPEDVVDRVTPLLKFRPTSLEQPVPHAHVSSLPAIREDLGIPVMLDESLCSLEDGRRAIDGGYCDLFNLRLSKCGGFVNCLKLAAFAAKAGLGYQLGCQVGETGILSAAGRHFACNVRGIRYLEGSYDRFLVVDRLTEEDLTFQFRGRGSQLDGHGLGTTVKEQNIRTTARRTECLIGGA